LIADMTRPGTSFHGRLFALLTLHGGRKLRFGIEDLPELLKAAGFERVKQLDDRFLVVGFVRATKPAA
jgi:hypothetical protein